MKYVKINDALEFILAHDGTKGSTIKPLSVAKMKYGVTVIITEHQHKGFEDMAPWTARRWSLFIGTSRIASGVLSDDA